MATSPDANDPLARSVRFTRTELIVKLQDGRTISTPLNWYPRLVRATPAQRRRWELHGRGHGIHWPDVDEDLSVEGMLRGIPAVGSEWRSRIASRTRRRKPPRR